MKRLKIIYATVAVATLILGGTYAYISLSARPMAANPPVGVGVDLSARVPIPASVSGLELRRITYWPEGFQKSGPQPMPGEEPISPRTYLIQFDVDTSKIGAIEWIMVEGSGKSFNVTSPLGYLHGYTQYPKQNATIVRGAGVLFGELGKVDLWRGGEQVQITFGFVTRDDAPLSAVTTRNTSVMGCQEVAEKANCLG